MNHIAIASCYLVSITSNPLLIKLLLSAGCFVIREGRLFSSITPVVMISFFDTVLIYSLFLACKNVLLKTLMKLMCAVCGHEMCFFLLHEYHYMTNSLVRLVFVRLFVYL